MKKYLFFLFSFITSLLVISCQDEDFGYTQEEIFRNAYERNFVKAFGPIDPNQSWDFSMYAYNPARAVSSAKTRAAGDAEDGWYKVPQNLLDDFLKKTLVQGNDNSGSGETFCFMSGHEDFTLTPIYQEGSGDLGWSLHMVMFDPLTGAENDKLVWSKSERLKVQSGVCTTCDGRGYVEFTDTENALTQTTKCKSCTDGYVKKTGDPEKDIECDACGGDGKIEHAIKHTECDANGKVQCGDCNGNGYTTKKEQMKILGFIPIGTYDKYYSCETCGGKKGNSWWLIGITRGTGRINCNNSNCVDGWLPRDCGKCFGDGQLSKCTYCNGTTNAHVCKNCNGSGTTSETAWQAIASEQDTGNAKGIEGQPITATQVLGVSKIPTGSIIYFYLDTDYGKQTSMEGGMRLYYPTEIGLGSDVKIIGCEENSASGGNNESNKDFNDLVFLLKGSPSPVITELGTPFKTTISKRYMAEDFGSNADWDFNDVVIDVTRETTQTLSKVSGEIKMTPGTKSVNVKVPWLCGTLPVKIEVEGVSTNKITDPTDPYRTSDEIAGITDERAQQKDEYGKHCQIGINPGISFSVPNWDPDENNVKIYVWKDWNKDGTAGDSENKTSVWTATFPQSGDTPYIIATDINDEWTAEREDIRGKDWFRSKFNN